MPRRRYDATPEVRAKWAANMRRVRQSPGWPASAHAPAKQAARADVTPLTQGLRRWIAAHPEKRAASWRRSGLVSSAYRYLCECGRVIYGPAAFRHASASGHTVIRQNFDS